MPRKFFIFSLVLVCTLIVLTACSSGPKDLTTGKTAEQIVEESFDKWYQLANYDMDMTSKMKMSLGQDVMDMSMSGKATIFQKPMKMKMVMDLTMPNMDEKMTIEQYMVEEGQKVIVYQRVGDQWQKVTVDDPAMAKMMAMDPRDNLKLFMDNLTKAEFLGEEKIEEMSTVKIDIIASSKIFEQVFEETAGNTLGLDNGLINKDILSKIGDMEYLIWINKATLETVKCQMDLTENMKNLGNALAEDDNLPDIGELKEIFANMEISMEYTVLNQNQAQDFTIPEEAKNAEEIPLSNP
jgi:hypothetical protein